MSIYITEIIEKKLMSKQSTNINGTISEIVNCVEPNYWAPKVKRVSNSIQWGQIRPMSNYHDCR